MLKIADKLKLPIDAATQTFAFIARKGAGKTYAAGKLVELLLDAGVQVVVLDAVGNWYGLRLLADGKSVGFDVPVLGGLRGDIPLEAAGGALIANIVVETGRSVVLDISQFSLADRKRFATSFGERLWQAKKAERHPSPLHLVIEESQLIVPQFTKGAETMVGIYEEIIRLGRNYGIGVSMITQRPQSVNKEVLNQTECLFVGQVNGAQEREALKKWITHQGMDVHLVDELPALKVGTFYVWSPQWLNLLEKVQILPKKTLDASATPKVGDKRVRRELKPLDLDDLREQLKATIEKQRAEDPRELRKQVHELQRQLTAKAATSSHIPEGKPPKRIEVSVLKPKDIARLEAIAKRFDDTVRRQADQLATVMNQVAPAVAAIAAAAKFTPPPARMPAVPQMPSPRSSGSGVHPVARTDRPAPRAVVSADASGYLPPGEKATLIAAAQYPAGITREQASILTAYKRSSRDQYINRLQAKGYLQRGHGNNIVATDAGLAALGSDYEPLPRGKDLQRYWLERLPPGEKAVLEIAIKHYPHPLDRDSIDEATAYKRSSRDQYIQRLQARQLLARGSGPVTASAVLFES